MSERATLEHAHDGRRGPRATAAAMRTLDQKPVPCARPGCPRLASHVGPDDQLVCRSCYTAERTARRGRRLSLDAARARLDAAVAR